jgi:hypothetical protein
MSLRGKFVELNERHKRELDWQRRAASRWNLDGRIAVDALFELSSVDQTVAFFADRLEYRRRLGSKHGTIPYRVVRAASLVARPPVSTSGPSITTFESELAVSKKLQLTIESDRRSLTFDFRTEPTEIIQEALALIERGMPLLETPRVDSDVQQTPPGHREQQDR